ncbi:MAG TPA: class I SAM-dependent methyltransferase [Rhizomicrobium sp.]|jgi:SAM-dependent methyltransferase|nr:class I SAM-dependent methyltransferase [Rhizomicrobium sp.]
MTAATAKTAIEWQGHSGPRLAHINGHDIVDCCACGFRHAMPLPDAATLEAAYRENYYADEKPTFLTHAGEDQAWAELAQTDRLEIFESYLRPACRRLLDIGSGPGFFLKTAQGRGWDVSGIEPSRQAAAHARGLGLHVVEGFFDADSAPRLGRYDVVHMNNVLEHIPDPINLVGLARDLLNPGGIICINVPNDFSPFQLAAAATRNTGEWWVAPPHHLNYFDFASLCALLQRLGFDILERTTSFPMEAFIMMGDNYVGDPVLGRACHTKRKRFDLALDAAGLKNVRRAFYRALAQEGIGREAVVIARLP